MSRKIIISDAVVINKIYVIRGEQVMIDMDLAELYEAKHSVYAVFCMSFSRWWAVDIRFLSRRKPALFSGFD